MLESLKTISVLIKDRRGVTAVEYAIVAGAIAAVVLTAFNTFGTRISHWMASISL